MSSETLRLPRIEPTGLVWACAQCVKDGLTEQPQGPASHGLCGPHMDLARIELAQWKAKRAA